MYGKTNVVYKIIDVPGGWYTIPTKEEESPAISGISSFFDLSKFTDEADYYYSYTDDENWLLQINNSGIFQFLKENYPVDIFLVGGGGKGGQRNSHSDISQVYSGGSGGGGGASVKISHGILPVKEDISIIIGEDNGTKINTEIKNTNNSLIATAITGARGNKGEQGGSKGGSGGSVDLEKNPVNGFKTNEIETKAGAAGGSGGSSSSTNGALWKGQSGKDSTNYAFFEEDCQILSSNNIPLKDPVKFGAGGGGGGATRTVDGQTNKYAGGDGGQSGGGNGRDTDNNGFAGKYGSGGGGGKSGGVGGKGIVLIRPSHTADTRESEIDSSAIDSAALLRRINELEAAINAINEQNNIKTITSENIKVNEEDKLDE